MNAFPEISKNADPIEALVTISRYYGSDPTIVLAGGGNTSVKIDDTLHVKASGTALATISPDGFVLLNRPQLDGIASAEYGNDVEVREAKYKAALLASRIQPERNQRPSVEALLHHVLAGIAAAGDAQRIRQRRNDLPDRLQFLPVVAIAVRAAADEQFSDRALVVRQRKSLDQPGVFLRLRRPCSDQFARRCRVHHDGACNFSAFLLSVFLFQDQNMVG